MEYADSGTLKDLLSRREQENIVYSNGELAGIFKQLAEGMKQINRHLVHRDIKPENILLCGNTLKISWLWNPPSVPGVQKSFSDEYKIKTPFGKVKVRPDNCTTIPKGGHSYAE